MPSAFSRALERLGLDRLVPLLDQTRRWELTLNEGEQHSLAFARVLLHVPPWLIIDEAMDTLDDDTLRRVARHSTRISRARESFISAAPRLKDIFFAECCIYS